MTIVYVFGDIDPIEELHRLARVPYLVAHTLKYGTQIETEEGHLDRIHGDIHDCDWQLSTDGKLAKHSDRYTDYLTDGAVLGKALLAYDDDKEDDDMNPAYYYNPTAAAALGCDETLTFISRAEAEVLGFIFESEII